MGVDEIKATNLNISEQTNEQTGAIPWESQTQTTIQVNSDLC
jgi:hypothetical protein